MQKLISAIVTNEVVAAKRLLTDDRSLANKLIKYPKLYQRGIFHWIYAGDTALHLAAAGYRVEIVKLLVKAGADPNAAANRRRASPLHYAADGFTTGPAWNEKQQLATIRELLRAGAEIDLPDANGATPLHRAVRTRCAAAVKLLLAAGANPAKKNKPGSTPFHLAVQNTGRGGSGDAKAIAAQKEIIKTLLAAGVSAKLKTADGKTVLDCACSQWVKDLLAGKDK
jgi:ankyrin repeat protein